jgi:hypothetical protein
MLKARAESNYAQRLVVDVDTWEIEMRVRFPASVTGKCLAFDDAPCGGEQEAECEVRGGFRQDIRSMTYRDSSSRGFIEVDMLESVTELADDPEPPAGRDDVSIDVVRPNRDQPIDLTDLREENIAWGRIGPGPHPDLVTLVQGPLRFGEPVPGDVYFGHVPLTSCIPCLPA